MNTPRRRPSSIRRLWSGSLLGLLFFAASVGFAAKVETHSLASASMHKQIAVNVVTPDSYSATAGPFPTLYLLHGYSGDASSWPKTIPVVLSLADHYGVIVVCPDGGFSSWYWDSPVDPSYKYETHIVEEVVPFVDRTYRTVKERSGRAISGASMGGHGALYLAFRHPEVFGAAGSMSGALDIRATPKTVDVAKRLGDYATHASDWESHSVINLTHLLSGRELPLIIDCGTEDSLIAVNRKLHEKLLYLNVPHDYIERAGGHNPAYWSNAVVYQMLFFRKFFDQAQASGPAPAKSADRPAEPITAPRGP